MAWPTTITPLALEQPWVKVGWDENAQRTFAAPQEAGGGGGDGSYQAGFNAGVAQAQGKIGQNWPRVP